MFKKSIFLFIVFFTTFVLQAQKISLEEGYISPKQFGSQFSTTYFNGMRIGLNAEFALKNNFSLLTGVLYNLVYSDKTQYYTSLDSVNYSTWGQAIQFPLFINYSLPVSKNFKFYAFTGPNISIGLSQQQRISAFLTDDYKTFTGIKTTGYANNDLYKKSIIQRINFQISAGAGMQFKNYRLQGGYDFGINSINKIDTNKLLHQSGWFVSLVYQF